MSKLDAALFDIHSAKESARFTAEVMAGIPIYMTTYNVLTRIVDKLESAEEALKEFENGA